MKETHIIKIRELNAEYAKIHEKMQELSDTAAQLVAEQNILHQNLIDIRNAEEDLINKIEEEIGRKLTPEDLIAAIKINEPT